MRSRTTILIALTAALLLAGGGIAGWFTTRPGAEPTPLAGRGDSSESPTTRTDNQPGSPEPEPAPTNPMTNLVPQHPGDTPAGGILDPATIDTNSAGAVAQAVVATLATIDTTTDYSPRDALRRAARWIDPTLFAAITTSPTSTNGQWLTLAGHRGYTTVTTELANEYGQPPDTTARAYQTISYTVTDHARDTWTPPAPATQLRRLQLTHTAAGWQVSAFLA